MKRNKKDNKQGPHWHPDFRDPGALPDVKVVRTSFFFNVCGIVVLCALLIVFFYREYDSRSVSEQIESMEGRLADRREQNQRAIDLNREFLAEAGKIDDLAAFLETPAAATEFLAELARALPDRILLSRIQYWGRTSPPEVVLAGRVLGASGDATDVVSAYENSFADVAYFAERVSGVNVRSVTRNPETDMLLFEFVLSLGSNDTEES